MKNRHSKGNSGFIYAAFLVLGALFILASGVSTLLSDGGKADPGDLSGDTPFTIAAVETSTATSTDGLVASSSVDITASSTATTTLDASSTATSTSDSTSTAISSN